jgi:hypothetical protein
MTDDDKALVERMRDDDTDPVMLKRASDRIEALIAENERLLNLLRDCDPESMSWLDARDAALEETK